MACIKAEQERTLVDGICIYFYVYMVVSSFQGFVEVRELSKIRNLKLGGSGI